MSKYFIIRSLAIALALLLINHNGSAQVPVPEPSTHELTEVEKTALPERKSSDEFRPRRHTYVYAKIVLPMKEPVDAASFLIESWIAKSLRNRGETQLRAVTDWVRLAEDEENSALMWMATVDGKYWGCPVYGRVAKRTTADMVKVDLTGWSPVGAEITGDTLPNESGSRRIAAVDTGTGDQDGRAFVALLVGPGRAIHDHAEENLAAIPWRDFSSPKLNALRVQTKPVLIFCRAEWDVTSRILERTVLTDRRVIEAVNQLEFVPLRADFTDLSKEIDRLLRDVGARLGEATFVVYPGPKKVAPIVIQSKSASEFISTSDLLDALKRARKANE